MGVKLQPLCSLLLLLTTAIAIPSIAVAEPAPANSESIGDLFDRAFFRHDRNFYENSTLKRQLDSFFGIGGFGTSFPENEIARDAELVNILYRDVLAQQSTNDPYIRTPDLPSPYGTSLLTSPRTNATTFKTGTEFKFDELTQR